MRGRRCRLGEDQIRLSPGLRLALDVYRVLRSRTGYRASSYLCVSLADSPTLPGQQRLTTTPPLRGRPPDT